MNLNCRKLGSNGCVFPFHFQLHYSELDSDTGAHNVQSVTEQSDLDNFLATAKLAGTDFTAGIHERVRRKKSSFHVIYRSLL